jgi:hypothetical protein
MKFGKFVVLFVTMILFLEFVAIPTGASVILSSFGIDINENYDLESADIGNSTFFNWVFGNAGILITIGAVGAVIIGLFAKSYDTSLIILPLIVTIGGLFASTSWAVISYCMGLGIGWLTKIVSVVFIGLGIAFLMSCIDYFANR